MIRERQNAICPSVFVTGKDLCGVSKATVISDVHDRVPSSNTTRTIRDGKPCSSHREKHMHHFCSEGLVCQREAS